jgi:hypothetical protein
MNTREDHTMSVPICNGLVYPHPRDQLFEHVGKKVRARATYRKYNQRWDGSRGNRTVLVDRLFVTVGDGITLDVDHVWVQHADAITSREPGVGERVEFTATVGTYVADARTDDDKGTKKVRRCHLSHPEGVVFPDRVPKQEEAPAMPEPLTQTAPEPTPEPEPESPPEPAPRPAVSHAEAVRLVRHTAEAVGGWEELGELVELLKGGE